MNIKNLLLAALTGLSSTAHILANPPVTTINRDQPITHIPQAIDATTWKRIHGGAFSVFVGATTGLFSAYATKAAMKFLKIEALNADTGPVLFALFAGIMLQEYTWRTKFMKRIIKDFSTESDKELMTDIARLAAWGSFLSPLACEAGHDQIMYLIHRR